MSKSLVKIISILLIIGLNWTGLSAVIETVAYYNDTETSSENIFSASTLDFSIPPTPDFPPEVTPAVSSSRDINLVNDGFLGFNYNVFSTSTSGILCDYLTLSAELEGNVVYAGSIAGFNFSAGEFSSSTDEWHFIVGLTSNDPALQNQTCTFDFVFNGVQIGGVGFSDQEIISNTVTSGQWVTPLKINEVYYDVKSPDHGTESQNEWIEIYNPTNFPVNISGWKITDNSGIERIFCVSPSTCSSTSIPAYGFAVVTPATSTWEYWPGIPSDAIKIILGKEIGDGLSNTGDRVILRDADGVEIDAVSWLSDDYAFGSGNGVKPATGAGHSIARKIKGLDTNLPDDWQKLTTPNPGSNPHLITSEGTPPEELEQEGLAEEELTEEPLLEPAENNPQGENIESEDGETISEESFNEINEEIIISGTDTPSIETATTEKEILSEEINEEVPAPEEQPTTLPEDGSNQEGGSDEIGDGDNSSGGDNGAAETGGEITGDSGEAGDSGETINE